MRALRTAFVLVCPALTGGAMLAAQAVERADVAGHGTLRVTFDPRIVGWDAQFVNGARLPLHVSGKGATLGLNPLFAGVANSGAQYGAFFTQFDTTLARLDANIAGGGYGCPPSRQCAAQAFLDSARTVRAALYEVVHGVGQTGAPFVPLDSSDGGRGIAQVVSYLQTRDSAAFNVVGFRDAFLPGHDT